MSIATTRARRTIKRPVTYWEEFVETDEWYLKEMVRDVPADELVAALEAEDFSNSASIVDDAETDADYHAPISDGSSAEDASSDCETSGGASGSGEEEESVHGSSEGESGSQSEDGQSEAGAAKERAADAIH